MSENKNLLIVKDSDDDSTINSEKNSSKSSASTSSNVPSTTTTPTSSNVPSTTSYESLTNITSPHENELEEQFKKLDCNDENFFTNDCNKFLLKKEILERQYLSSREDEDNYLYPILNDKEFNIKIATKKEFNDSKYDGTIYEDIKKQADVLAKADFELQPHQAFVKNFMSFQTPYSSLLL